MKNLLKNKNGITLIALVVTIVVLIILATITITLVLGDNGILNKAKIARDSQANAVVNDSRTMDEIELQIKDAVAKQEGKVARIETTYYSTLQEAFDEVPTDETPTTVELLKSISENVIVKENQNILLQMNGNTVTNVEGTALAGDWEQATFEVYGDLEVNNGKIVGVYGCAIEHYGNTININENVKVVALETTYQAIYCASSNGTINIDGGEIATEISNAICCYGGVININEGTITSKGNRPTIYYESSNGAVNINGGEIESEISNTIYCYEGVITINEGTITSKGDYSTIYCESSNGTINVYGGNINTKNANAIQCYDGVTLNITGGNITSESTNYPVIYIESSNLNISGGNINTNTSKTCVNIKNCKVNIGGNAVIKNSSTQESACGIYFSSYTICEISGGSISSAYGSALFINFSNEINITGGEIKATGDATAIWNDKCANLIISGGDIVAENGYALYTPSAYGAYSTEICGGNFINNSTSCATVYDSGSQITISAGTITNLAGYYGLELRGIPTSKEDVITSDEAVISSMNF